MQELLRSVNYFSFLQKQFSNCGASDTEPDREFHWVIWNALHGKPFKAPNWELFSFDDNPDMKFQSEFASKLMTSVAEQVYNKLSELKNNSEVRSWAREFAWRSYM